MGNVLLASAGFVSLFLAGLPQSALPAHVAPGTPKVVVDRLAVGPGPDALSCAERLRQYLSIHRSHLDGRGSRRLLVITAFIDDSGSSLHLGEISESGRATSVRAVCLANQNSFESILSKRALKLLKAFSDDPPQNQEIPSISGLTVISFQHAGQWHTRYYDTRVLPEPVRKLYVALQWMRFTQHDSQTATPN